jgi:signal transduction histidine kinase
MSAKLLLSSRPLIFIIGFISTLAIGIIDYLTGIELSFSIFYLAPIAYVTWYTGRREGILMTALSSFVYLLADELGGHVYSNLLYPYWNSAVHSGIFLIVTFSLSRIKESLRVAEDGKNEAEMAQKEAEAANRSKDQFLAVVSHELRTPLTAILGWIRLLRNGTLDASNSMRALETIERNARIQLLLIEDLLDTSRIIVGKLHLDLRPIELATVIEESIDILRPTAQSKSIDLQFQDVRQGIGMVIGDQHRLRQIVWNLLSNAIKFTPEGGRVEIRLKQGASFFEVSVMDTGRGIEPELLPHVFERFRQADNARSHGGLGLGLAIVRHLVELHGGTVEAASGGKGKGATFTIKLPVMAAGMEIDGLDRIDWIKGSEQSYGHSIRLDGLRVLVVDDESNSREVLEFVLTECGAEIKTCASVSEALDVLEKWKPDLLVSDIGMPIEDGYELMRQARVRVPQLMENIPAVAVTAHTKDDDQKRVLSAGFRSHMSKPIDPKKLIATLASLARRI